MQILFEYWTYTILIGFTFSSTRAVLAPIAHTHTHAHIHTSTHTSRRSPAVAHVRQTKHTKTRCRQPANKQASNINKYMREFIVTLSLLFVVVVVAVAAYFFLFFKLLKPHVARVLTWEREKKHAYIHLFHPLWVHIYLNTYTHALSAADAVAVAVMVVVWLMKLSLIVRVSYPTIDRCERIGLRGRRGRGRRRGRRAIGERARWRKLLVANGNVHVGVELLLLLLLL